MSQQQVTVIVYDDKSARAAREARNRQPRVSDPDMALKQQAQTARSVHVVPEYSPEPSLTASLLRAKASHLGRYWPREGR